MKREREERGEKESERRERHFLPMQKNSKNTFGKIVTSEKIAEIERWRGRNREKGYEIERRERKKQKERGRMRVLCNHETAHSSFRSSAGLNWKRRKIRKK